MRHFGAKLDVFGLVGGIVGYMEASGGQHGAKMTQDGQWMRKCIQHDPKDTQKHLDHKPVMNRTGSAFELLSLDVLHEPSWIMDEPRWNENALRWRMD